MTNTNTTHPAGVAPCNGRHWFRLGRCLRCQTPDTMPRREPITGARATLAVEAVAR